MDGVPGLTQQPVQPGESFAYAFNPPDAGTFWYHSHEDSLVQTGRGLAGALIVTEAEPPTVDRELLWAIQDWRLTRDAQIAPGFHNRMEEAMDGRVGNTVTINGRVPDIVRVRAGQRLRLRLLNASIARIMALRFEEHRPAIVALDGQPCEPHDPLGGRILLGPAMRADVILDMQGEPGQTYRVVDDFYDPLAYTVVRLSYDKAPPLRPHPPDGSLRLPPNPVPRADLTSALVHEVRLQGGMMGGLGMMGGGMMGMGGGAAWAINGQSMTGDGSASMPPLFQIGRGRSCVLDLRNETAWWHPMHLHGHSFNVLSRDGASVPHDVWGDTVLVRPRERVRVAFVADNPGDWMLHCHVMNHQVGGMMTTIRVT
jgi:FtsP/CotA-like multicopper oxidase with cupredoxin domain